MRVFWHIIRFILFILGAIEIGVGLTTTIVGIEPFSRFLISLLVWMPIFSICIYFERRYKNPPKDDVVARQTKVRKPLLYGFLIFIGVLLLISLIANSSRTRNTTTEQQTPAKALSKYETGPPDPQEMLELVNKERAKVGVAPLKMQANLVKSSQYKADDFVSRNYYSHADPATGKNNGLDYLAKIDNSCSYISENIAADMLTSYEPFYGKNSWLDSAPHRKAILDPRYTYTGFGVSQEGDGDYYIVEHFCIAR